MLDETMSKCFAAAYTSAWSNQSSNPLPFLSCVLSSTIDAFGATPEIPTQLIGAAAALAVQVP